MSFAHRARVLGLSLLVFFGGSVGYAETIRVGAAISMKEALAEVAAAYTKAGGDTVEFNFGSSGQILTQIKSGAELDVFISAANKQVDELEKESLAVAGTRRVVVLNALVLIVPADAKSPPARFEDLGKADIAKVAIGEPKTVPAGQYAEQVIKSLDLTSALTQKLVYGTNVRQVLTYVERGEVSAGIVYATDARESGDKVRVVATANPATHEPIVYPAVVIGASKKQDAATKFLAYLETADAKAIFVAKGFRVPSDVVAPVAK